MRAMKMTAGMAATLCLALLAGCGDRTQSNPLAPDASPLRPPGGQQRAAQLSLDLCAFGQRFTLASENDYFPLGPGSRWVYRGEEDGARIELRIRVLGETEVVGGVTTRVVEEREFEDGELIEHSRNFFAEARDGTVCYFGEEVDIYEGGEVVSHAGAWRADAPGNRPGIIMPAEPRPGMTFQMEGAPGVAEDQGTIVGTGRVTVPAGRFRETIRVRETNPLDGSSGIKVFAEDVGLVVDGPLSLVRYHVADADGDEG